GGGPAAASTGGRRPTARPARGAGARPACPAAPSWSPRRPGHCTTVVHCAVAGCCAAPGHGAAPGCCANLVRSAVPGRWAVLAQRAVLGHYVALVRCAVPGYRVVLVHCAVLGHWGLSFRRAPARR